MSKQAVSKQTATNLADGRRGIPIEDSSAAYCPSLTREPLSSEQAEALAPALKALGDPVRLRLLSLIASHQDGEACVCQLTDTFDLSGPTISHHLKVLREAGLIDGERRGTWIYYRARPTALQQLCCLLTPTDQIADACAKVEEVADSCPC